MRALTWHGKHDVRMETVPDPKIVNPRDAIIKITSTAICGSDLHLYDSIIPSLMPGDILGHEFMGEVMEVGEGNNKLKVGAAGGGAVHHLLRQVLLLRTPAVLGVRQLQSRRQGRHVGDHVRPPDDGGLRLLPPDGRLRRRTGRVCPRAVLGRGPDRDPRRAGGRQGAVPLRHPAHRLDGGGKLRDPARRHGGDLGRGARRPVRRAERLPAGRAPGDLHRPSPPPPRTGAAEGRRGDQLSRRQGARGAGRDDRRHRRRRLHRRGGPGVPRLRLRQRRGRGEGRHPHGHGPRPRPARGHPRLPQGGPRLRSPASTAASSTSSPWAR